MTAGPLASTLGPRGGARPAVWTLLGPVADALAEGSWTWVAYLLLGIMGGGDRPLGLVAFIVVAAAGIALGARIDIDAIGAAPVAAACVAVALVGLAISPAAGARLVAGDPLGALAAHAGGPILGLTALRGILRGRAVDAPDPDASGFGWVAALLVGCWFFGAALVQPGRGVFTAGATGPTILYVLSAPGAAALLQVRSIARSQGWTRSVDRSWLGLLVATLLVAGGIAWLAASSTSQLGAIGPLLVLGILAIAVSRLPTPARRPRSAGALGGWLVLLIVLFIILAVVHPLAAPPNNLPASAATASSEDESGRQGGTILLIVGLAVGALLVLVVLGQRRDRRPLEDVAPDAPSRLALDRAANPRRRLWLPWRRRPGPPGDAVGAYRAALAELAHEPATERQPGETPSEHARRLRVAGTGGLALELLAADYELVRFGGRDLAAREHARAIGRWHTVRDAAEARRWAEALAQRAAAERRGGEEPSGPDQDDEATRERAGRV
jgi:hypothetical protein